MNKEKVAFVVEAVKSFKTSGALFPSSRFLVKKILKNIVFSNSELIVEFGPGNGKITKEILKKIKPSATLVCFEINEVFYKDLLQLKNKQLIVLNISAENVQQEIQKLGFNQIDNIISSLPLTMIPKNVAINIINNAYKILRQNGKFIQYQYSTLFLKEFKSIFKKKVILNFEMLNLPPAFVYKCIK